MNFADTNWLEALYFDSEDREKQARCGAVERFMRKHGGQLGISHLVYLEARNVFSRNAEEAEPILAFSMKVFLVFWLASPVESRGVQHEDQGPACQRAAARTAYAFRGRLPQPCGIGGHLAADGIEG